MPFLDDYRALRDAAALLDRSGRGRIRLTGADRRAYLQGLLTNDIVVLTPGTGCYAAYLTAQGRMIADMRVFEMGDALLVDLEGDLEGVVAARWEQFIFSEDVQVQTLSSSTAQLGVYGPRAPDVIASALAAGDAETLRSMSTYASAPTDFQGTRVYLLRSDDIGVEGFDLVLPAEKKRALSDLLAGAGARLIGPEAAEICRVEGGRPKFHVDMDEDTIPLEAGIEDRAISLTKGCYVGQEIIIRVLHRGHGRVARKLVGIAMDPAAQVPARGEKIFSAEREIGSITSAVGSPALGRPIALGYVHRDFTQPGTAVAVATAAGRVTGLPFVATADAES